MKPAPALRSHRRGPCPRTAGPLGESGVILTLLLLLLLAFAVGAVAWVTRRAEHLAAAEPPSSLAACSLLADTALAEGKGKLIAQLDARFQRAERYPLEPQALASGAMQGSSYRVEAVGRAVPGDASVLDQPIEMASTCTAADGAVARVVVEGQARSRSAFDPPFCACGDVEATGKLAAGFTGGDGSAHDRGRLLLAANGTIRVPDDADIQGGVIAGGDLLGRALPAGGSLAGGKNEAGGAAEVLPTPRPCRCEDTVVERGLPVSPPPPPARVPVPGGCAQLVRGGSLELPEGASCTFVPGRYALTRVVLGADSSIAIQPPVRLELSGDGPFDLSGATFSHSGDASALTIESTSTRDLLLGAGDLDALIFAPRARVVVVAGGARIRGALVGGHLALPGATVLQADPIASSAAPYVFDFREDTWQMNPVTP